MTFVPPSNHDAERGVLAIVLRDPSQLSAVRERLTPGDFWFREYRAIYAAACELDDAGKVVAPTTVLAALNDATTGGLTEAIMDTIPSDALETLVAAVQKASRNRTLAVKLAELQAKAQANAEDPQAITAQADALLRTVGAAEDQACQSAESVAAALIAEIDEMNQSGKVRAFQTGVGAIDENFWVKPTDLFVIGGRPGNGKSFLGGAIACGVAESGRGVLWASAEMPPADLVARAARRYAVLDADVFRAPTDRDRAFRAAEAIHRVGRLPLWFTTKTHIDVLLRVAREKARSGSIVALVVDFLQRLTLPHDWGSEQERLGRATSALKQFAIENRVPVFLLSSLNRGANESDGQRPTMASLRGSGNIESDADTVLLLHRRDDWVTEWLVAKARESVKGRDRAVIEMRRNFARGEFVEDAWPT